MDWMWGCKRKRGVKSDSKIFGLSPLWNEAVMWRRPGKEQVQGHRSRVQCGTCESATPVSMQMKCWGAALGRSVWGSSEGSGLETKNQSHHKEVTLTSMWLDENTWGMCWLRREESQGLSLGSLHCLAGRKNRRNEQEKPGRWEDGQEKGQAIGVLRRRKGTVASNEDSEMNTEKRLGHLFLFHYWF